MEKEMIEAINNLPDMQMYSYVLTDENILVTVTFKRMADNMGDLGVYNQLMKFIRDWHDERFGPESWDTRLGILNIVEHTDFIVDVLPENGYEDFWMVMRSTDTILKLSY